MRRKIHLTFVLLLGALLAPHVALAADSTAVRAILITASNEKAPSDPRLAAYEAELQRNLVFSSFRYVGEGSANIPPRGHATVSLARGHRIEVEADKSGGGPIRVKAQWMNGNNVVMSTTLTLQPGVPAVLVRRGGDEAAIPVVLLFAK